MILCSPSPGTSCPERMMCGARQCASVSTLCRMKKASCAESAAMNSVPGVMQLESNGSRGTAPLPPRAAPASARARARAPRRLSVAGWAVLRH
jgi:hypothetical protein